ncbi:hypothetical protein [Clostridium manihotivorum]|uniref:Uncharacterized protein n=1 Tax=Clostridium manihotivorum TaxID=2320868 RepID=A0A410DQ59_9CLOT|nr:hypothetical protein [Clostridium manihotivorum]QAA31177.1 hypothetical protein C1I91_05580 [Clostridium manihotivorum]
MGDIDKLRGQELYESIKEYIEYDESKKINQNIFNRIVFNKEELLSLFNECSIEFDATGIYGDKTDYFKEFVQIRVPIALKSKLDKYGYYLDGVCRIYYKPNGKYELAGINILPDRKRIVSRNIEFIEKQVQVNIDPKNIVYDNFKIHVITNSYDKVEKDYIMEACNCGISGNRLATATMIGCAAERLLILLCEAYSAYLIKHGSQTEISKFNNEILNAKKAHKRLEGFFKVISNKKELFSQLGFENHEINFSFLDIIRQVRNDAGHPTGVVIESERLQTIITNYSLLYNKIHELIDALYKYE